MISYDSYKNRIEKVAKVKTFIVKFKFLIIGILAVLIAGITALLVMKGMITSAMVLPAEITYGETYSPSAATAFLSDVNYEYALQGSDEWSEEKPIKVGKYYARTVTSKAIGKGYGEPVAFEIVPKEVEFVLNDTKMTYGNAPSSYSLNGIVSAYGDNIQTVDFDYDYHDESDDYGEWTVDVTVNLGKVRVVDKNGEDASDCYSYESLTKTLALQRRTISGQLKRTTVVYSGVAFGYDPELDEVYGNTLANGDDIEFETEEVVLLNANTYLIRITSAKIYCNGEDVTRRYVVPENITATFVISPRPVTVNTDSDSKTYDGTALSANGGTADGLASGHSLEFTSAAPAYINAGSYRNARDYIIKDARGEDVTFNYSVSNSFGTLTINRRPVTVQTGSYEWIYDGAAHGLTDTATLKITSQLGLVSGHTLEFVGIRTVSNVKETELNNNTSTVKITGVNGDETANYAISYDCGTLTITKRPVTIKTEDNSKTYDGSSLYSVSHSATNLVPGHSERVITQTTITDVNTVEDASVYSIYNGYVNVTENYNITYDYGTLTVTKRPVNITLNSFSVTYGDTISYQAGNEVNDNIVWGQYISVTPSAVKFGYTKTLPDIGNYDVSCENSAIKIYSGSKDVTFNYDVKTPSNGTLTVTKRYVSVTLNTFSVTYGDKISYQAGNENNYNIVSGQTVSVDPSAVNFGYTKSMPDVGNYNISCNSSAITIYDGNSNVKDNYVITPVNGTLKIIKREITVKTATDEFEYDGNLHSNVENEIISDVKLAAESHYLSVSSTYAITDVADSKTGNNSTTFVVLSTNSEQINGNYQINYEKGTLTVTPRPITVVINPAQKDYDGTPLYNDSDYSTLYYGSEEAGLLSGSLTPVQSTVNSITDAGSKQNTVEFTASSNYEIKNYDRTNATLTVNKLNITVALKDITDAIYGNTPVYEVKSGNYANLSTGYLVWGEELTVLKVNYSFTKSVPDVGNYDITAQDGDKTYYKVTKSNGADGSDNYMVEFTGSTLTITPRPITLLSATNTTGLTYNGAAQFDESYSITSGSLVANQKIEATHVTTVTDVNEGSVDNVLIYVIKTAGGEDVTDNYSITKNTGKIKINPRPITVQPNDITATYGVTPVYEVKAGNYKSVSSGSLVNGETLTINYIVYQSSLARGDVGEYTFNVRELYGMGSHFSVLKSGGTDSTGNYSVTFTSGTLKITARKIIVTIDDNASCIYGTVLYGENALKPEFKTAQVGGGEGLVNGDELVPVFSYLLNGVKPDRYDVGSYTITLDTAQSYFKYSDGTRQTAKNYDIETVNDGTLTVTQRNITLTFKPLTYTYGDICSNGGEYIYWTRSGGDSVYLLKEDTDGLLTVGGYGLAYGEYFSAITFDAGEVVYNAGTYTLALYSYVIYPSDNKNYNISYSDDLILKIDSKKVTVDIGDNKVTYGDYENALDGVTFTTSEGLAFDETLTLTGFALANGKSDFHIGVFGSPYVIDSAEKQTFFDRNGAELTDGAANYVITVKGTLTVEPRTIVIELLDLDDVYYGDDLPEYKVDFGNYKLLAGSLAYEQKLKIQVCWENSGGGVLFEIPSLNAGTYEYDLVDGASDDTGFYENDGKTTVDYSNYSVSSTGAKSVTINPLKVTIMALDATNKEYDGNPYEYQTGFNNFSFGNGLTALPYGEQIEISVLYLSIISQNNYSPLDGAPVNVGEYAYRFEKVVGFKKGTNDKAVETNYIFTEGNYERFEITPRQVTLTADDITVIYGETLPDITATGDRLVSGHKVSVEKWHFLDSAGNTVYVPQNAGEYTIVITSAVAFNGADNVSENYDFSYETGTLIINVREITLTPNCDGKVYDGEAVTVSGYSDFLTIDANKAGFVYGDEDGFTIDYEFFDKDGNLLDGAPVDAGKYYVKVKNLGSLDNYSINYEKSDFEIEKRKITVKTDSLLAVEYDGKEHSTEYYTTYLFGDESKPGLLNGDELKVEYLASFINADTYDNDTTFACGDNYEIERYVPGTIEITQKKIIIDLLDIPDRPYNGEEQTYQDGEDNFYLIQGAFADGEKLTVKVAFSATPKNAGKYKYGYESGTISGNPEGDGILNYDISFLDGVKEKSFEITKLDLTIILNPIENCDYDGDPHEYQKGDEQANGILKGEELSVAVHYFEGNNQLSGAPVDKGTYTVRLDADNTFAGDYSVETNYNVTCEEISFTISPRKIVITMGDETRTYDSKDYDYNSDKKNFVVDNVVNGETIVPNVICVDENGNAPRNAGGYSIIFVDFTVEGGSGKVENYEIDYEKSILECTLTIEQYEIDLQVVSRAIERPENFTTPLSDEAFNLNAFFEADRASVEYTFKYKNEKGETVDSVYAIGKYYVTVEVTGNDEILNNYTCNYGDPATLEITARQVTVIPHFDGKIYDGEPVSENDLYFTHYHTTAINETGFVNGDENNYTVTYVFDGKEGFYPVNAGDYNLEIKITGYDENDYKLTCESVTVTINKRPVGVKVVLGTDFDGLSYSHDKLPTAVTFEEFDLGIKDSGRLENDVINYEYEIANSNYGVITLCFAGDYSVCANDLDNGNYYIANAPQSTFTVAKQVLYIKPNDKSALYEDLRQVIALGNSDFSVLYGNIIDGDAISISYSGYLSAPVPLTMVTITGVQFNYNSKNVTGCYDLHYNYSAGDSMGYPQSTFTATLMFEKRNVYFTQKVLNQTVFTYDGTSHTSGIAVSDDLFEIVAGGDGLLNGDVVSAIAIKPVIRVGTYDKWIVFMVKSSEGKVVTSLYNFIVANEESILFVVGDYVTLTFDDGFDVEEELEKEDSAYLAASQYAGYYLIQNCYTVEIENSDTNNVSVEVLVSETSGEVKVIVFEETGGNRSDNCYYYSLKTYGIKNEVAIVPIYTLSLGNTSN